MIMSRIWAAVVTVLVLQYMGVVSGQLVTTNSGQLLGHRLESRGGYQYYSYKGIPYAEKPERFQVAQPVKPWNGVKDAGNYGPQCNQATGGSEDCLYLNIFSPVESRCANESVKGKLPVLFHIHGGAFEEGSGGNFGPHFLMDECVVHVTINYRLGALGFLTTGDELIPGNLGLKDALLALKWINENVGFFRGDNRSITLNGVSAGGVAVSHFIASPAATDLFHRVIAQSGSSLDQWAVVKNPRDRAFRLGRSLNCTGSSSQELMVCLKGLPADVIVAEQGKLIDWRFAPLPTWGPVVEPEGTVEPFQTEDPYLRYVRGDFNKVPMITGTMRDEGLTFYAGHILASEEAKTELNNNWDDLAPLLYWYRDLNLSSNVQKNISSRIRQYYLHDKPVGDASNGADFINSNTDRMFGFGTYEEAILHSKHAPVYHYLFTFEGYLSFASLGLGLNYTAAGHGDDHLYLFDIPGAPQPPVGTRSYEFSKNLIKLWVSFMKTGKPDAVWGSVMEWEQFNATSPKTLKLDLPAELLTNSQRERMSFWDSLNLRGLQFPDTK